MKNLSYVIFCTLFLFTACKKSGIVDDTGDVNTDLGSPVSNLYPLTYKQIDGNYMLTDSIHYIGNQAVQFHYDDSTHKIAKSFAVSINEASASFTFDGQTYIETRSVANEYQTDDKAYTWKKIRFSKDSVFINYFDRDYDYSHSLSLSITLKGYKLK